ATPSAPERVAFPARPFPSSDARRPFPSPDARRPANAGLGMTSSVGAGPARHSLGDGGDLGMPSARPFSSPDVRRPFQSPDARRPANAGLGMTGAGDLGMTGVRPFPSPDARRPANAGLGMTDAGAIGITSSSKDP